MRMKKRKLLIVLGAVAVLIIGGGVTYAVSHNKRVEAEKAYVEKVDKQVAEIRIFLSDLEEEKNSTKQFTKLKSIENDFANYKKGKEKDAKVINAYERTIKSGKKFFIDKNEKILKDNSTVDINKETLETLKKKIENLETLLRTIDSQSTIVYSKNEPELIKKEASDLVKSYQEKLKELEKKAAEKKKEAEGKARAEQEKTAEGTRQVAEQSQQQANQENVNAAAQSGGQDYSNQSGQAANTGGYVDPGYSYNPAPSNQAPAAPVAPTPAPSSGGNGWSANEDGSGKHETNVENNGDGSWTVDPGNGNDAGWSIN